MGGPLSRRSFVCFGAKPNKGLGLKISDETGSGGGKELEKESERELAKRDAERSRERTAEGTRQDELAVLGRQRSAEGSSEGRPVNMSWHSW